MDRSVLIQFNEDGKENPRYDANLAKLAKSISDFKSAHAQAKAQILAQVSATHGDPSVALTFACEELD